MASSLKNVIFVQAIFFVGLLGFDVCSLRAFDERTDQVDRIFLDVDKKDSPGASISILHKGDVVYRKSYGMANLEHGVPISTKTIFDIASISKQFGAMSIILLSQDEELSLDDDIRLYLPEAPDFGHPITIRNLLHHTSGVRDWVQLMVLAGVEMSDVISFEKILKMFYRQNALNFIPGDEYSYSNTGYNLLAEIVQRVSGMSFRAFTDERIFRPLGMHRTHFYDEGTEIIKNRAHSYEPNGNDGYKNSTNQLTALSSSSLHTSIEDFTKWMFNYDTGVVGGDEGIAQLQERGVLNNGQSIPYARGVAHGEYRGLATVGHGGSWRGFRTQLLRFTSEDFSVAVFCNFSSCEPMHRAQQIADIYLIESLAQSTVRGGTTEPRRSVESQSYEVENMGDYEGKFYSVELDTTYKVRVSDDALIVDHWRNDSITLIPTGKDRFESSIWWLKDVRFFRQADGDVISLGVTGDRVRNLRFVRAGGS
jgi:CubicO group peptidase (beta-lactamase class C family)